MNESSKGARNPAQGWLARDTRVGQSPRSEACQEKRGIVVVAGQENKDIAPGTLRSIWRQAGLEDKP